MINIKPTINKNSLQLKPQLAGAVHSSGDFYMHNKFSAVDGILQEVFLDFTDSYGDNNSNYTGHVKITATATRAFDGTTLDIGIATFDINSVTLGANSSANKISSDANWDSWTLRGAGTGFENYINTDLYSAGNKSFQFYKGEFCTNELDPTHNIMFINSYSIDIVFKVEYIHRRPGDITTVNTIRTVDNNSEHQTSAVEVTNRPEVNVAQGTVADDVKTFLGLGANHPGSILIVKDSTYDFLLSGTFSTISGAIGSSRMRPITSITNTDPNTRNAFSIDIVRSLRTNEFPTTVDPAFPVGSFLVDFNDTTYNTGNNIVLYHQTAFGTSSTNGRAVGYTVFDLDTPITPSTYPSANDSLRSTAKFPKLTHQGNVAWNSGIAFTAAPIIPRIITTTRVNDRPLIYVRGNNIGIGVNNGTHATPVYNKLLSAKLTTGGDTSVFKYLHNVGSVPTELKLILLINMVNDEVNGWTYITSLSSATKNRQFFRIQYSGPGGTTPTLADCWNWNNWTIELLANWQTPSSQILDSVSSNTIFSFTNMPYIFGALCGEVVYGTANGFPVFYGIIRNKLCKWYHNGGTSTTNSDNWNIEILAGSTSTSATIPIEGTAFTAEFTFEAQNSWFYRQQVYEGWYYFGVNNADYIGRVCIDSTNADYLKFEVINQLTTSRTSINSI